MKTTFKIDIYEALDLLKAIDKPFIEVYYENDCITDYKKKPYQMFFFTRVFGVKKGNTGKLSFFSKREIIEITGNSQREIAEKLEKEVDKCEGMVLDGVTLEWIPEKWLTIRKGIKAFNLLEKPTI